MKFVKWLVKSLVISLVLLFAINLLGSFISINIPVNAYTIVIISILRLPGAIALIIFYML